MRDIDMGKAYERRTPRSLPGLQVWLDARNGLFQDVEGATPVTTDGQTVALQKNRAGTNYGDFTQPTEARRPTYQATGLNGWPGLLCAEATPKQLLRSAGPTLATGDLTLAFVYDAHDASGTSEAVFHAQTGALIFYHFIPTGSETGISDNGAVTSMAAALEGPQVVICHFSDTTATLYRNGASVGTAEYTPETIGGSVGVGGSFVQAAGLGFDGTIGDFLFYNRALAPDEIVWLSNFLNTRYGGNIF